MRCSLSSSPLGGVPVTVTTASASRTDTIGVTVESPLVITGQLRLRLRFPRGVRAWCRSHVLPLLGAFVNGVYVPAPAAPRGPRGGIIVTNHEDIAKKTRVSLSKVKTDILRGREALAKILVRSGASHEKFAN